MSRRRSKEVEREVEARRAALCVLFAADITSRRAEELMVDSYATLQEVLPGIEHAWERVEARVLGVADQLDRLNAAVQRVSPRWKLERMATIDRNILRLGAWELLSGDQPPRAVINACIELGKDYGEQGTPAFINGLLDELCRRHEIPIT